MQPVNTFLIGYDTNVQTVNTFQIGCDKNVQTVNSFLIGCDKNVPTANSFLIGWGWNAVGGRWQRSIAAIFFHRRRIETATANNDGVGQLNAAELLQRRLVIEDDRRVVGDLMGVVRQGW